MAFTPKTWQDGAANGDLVTAAELNRIETGVGQAHELLDAQTSLAPAFPLAGRLLYPFISLSSQASIYNGTLQFHPLTATRSCTIERLGINVTTAQVGATARLGIYEPTAEGLPGSLISEAGVVDLSATGLQEVLFGSPVTLGKARLHWMAVLGQHSGSTPSVTTTNHTSVGLPGFPQDSPVPGTMTRSGFHSVTSYLTGSLPATAGSVNIERMIPAVFARVSEVLT